MTQSTFQVKVQLMVSVREPKAARQVSLTAPCRAQQCRIGKVLVPSTILCLPVRAGVTVRTPSINSKIIFSASLRVQKVRHKMDVGEYSGLDLRVRRRNLLGR